MVHEPRVSTQSLALAIVLVAGLTIARSAVAEPPAVPEPSKAMRAAFAAGYERGAADALHGKDTGAAIDRCEQKRKQAENLVAEQQPYMDRGDRYAHCLIDIRNAMAVGPDILRTTVRRCTAEFP
jgi:hypothetical protein